MSNLMLGLPARVPVFNAGGDEQLHTVDLLHAIKMLNRQVARVREAVPGATFGPHPVPMSLELRNWIYSRWLYGEHRSSVPHPSRENILRRDRWTCAYCGRTGDTFDHIVPRHAGGKTTWLNCVAACADCNNKRKGRKTLAQAGMRLQYLPFVPTWDDLLPRRR